MNIEELRKIFHKHCEVDLEPQYMHMPPRYKFYEHRLLDLIKEIIDTCEIDARRYRWLRHGDNDELVMQRGPVSEDYVYLPRNEKLDEMIDHYMKSNL